MIHLPGVGLSTPSRFHWMPTGTIGDLFVQSGCNPAVPMGPAPAPVVLWINHRLAIHDPAFADCGGDWDRYTRHLLDACGRMLALESDGGDGIGIADRYGGSGIGSNGGSGRATFVSGYYVKGVGPTPLIGHRTDGSHATGGAFLEEAVRETIMGEVVAAEFPFGAVGTLAIIDTGIIKQWVKEGYQQERQVLIVRPPFLRPAHLERAWGFVASDPAEILEDVRRVGFTTGWLLSTLREQGVRDWLGQFFSNWAEQLAFGFVHRLAHGGASTSNISVDGSLVDFGACSALPSWAQIDVAPGVEPSGIEMEEILKSVQSVCFNLARYAHPTFGTADTVNTAWRGAVQSYRRRTCMEILRLCGLDSASHDSLPQSAQICLAGIVARMLKGAQRRFGSVHEDMTALEEDWLLGRIWDDTPPAPLLELRAFLEEMVHVGCRAAAQETSKFLTRTRDSIYREKLRERLMSRLRAGNEPGWRDTDLIGRIICEEVVQARRVSAHQPPGTIPVGFALGLDVGLLLFRYPDEPDLSAQVEWAGTGSAVLKVVEWGEGWLRVIRSDGGERTIRCAIHLHPPRVDREETLAR